MVYIASSESCKPKIFVQCWNKVERKYIQEQKSNKFPCYNQSMGFVNRMDQNMGMYTGFVLNEKMVVVLVCLNVRCCSSGCVGIVSY